ncbi:MULTISPECIES: hypothetical protein [unclassified Rhodococcus (in: high G+C Gram-positive bacteria)]|uniref:hypothetical protein n=1 Tax=unclassified Rhodococcus (in: high G+C Gram-positive bacteria) TaxID=192944 RepID=UPI00077A50CE|nr:MULTISPECIES: hypothetical protein [unclassified Rhodococcus (in: high G+C Gram-positive bacteria)]KXX62404.1 hypothetical protein AZG88_29565 [Rhodococcus sp. LB1]PBC56458.1 hypothetical protein CJ177_12485 [Rhodococcus sp. ACPA1]
MTASANLEFRTSNSLPEEQSTTDAVTFSIECIDSRGLVRQLGGLFHRHGVELIALSSWCSLRADRHGITVSAALPPGVQTELLVKKMNRFVDVVKIRLDTREDDVYRDVSSLEVVATGPFVEKVALVGYQFGAGVVDHSPHRIILRLNDTRDIVGAFHDRLRQLGRIRSRGDIRVSPMHPSGSLSFD